MRLSTLILILCFGYLFLFLLPTLTCGCSSKEVSKGTACLSNTKQQALGLILYAEDGDGRLPHRDYWLEGIAPYVKEGPLHDPVLGPKGQYGYAFNSRLSRAKISKDAETTPMVYDSSNLTQSASDPFTSLPVGGRHKGKNNVAYADGHSRRVPVK